MQGEKQIKYQLHWLTLSSPLPACWAIQQLFGETEGNRFVAWWLKQKTSLAKERNTNVQKKWENLFEFFARNLESRSHLIWKMPVVRWTLIFLSSVSFCLFLMVHSWPKLSPMLLGFSPCLGNIEERKPASSPNSPLDAAVLLFHELPASPSHTNCGHLFCLTETLWCVQSSSYAPEQQIEFQPAVLEIRFQRNKQHTSLSTVFNSSSSCDTVLSLAEKKKKKSEFAFPKCSLCKFYLKVWINLSSIEMEWCVHRWSKLQWFVSSSHCWLDWKTSTLEWIQLAQVRTTVRNFREKFLEIEKKDNTLLWEFSPVGDC